MGADEVDALWICAPNDTRVDMMRTIHGQVKAGQAQLLGVACEKPLARTIAEGREVIIETTTSWAYVGSGLRIQLELLGPEYSMEFSSLNTGLKIFLSRAVTGAAGEDMVEKQNAEQGLMPVLEDEAGIYGYTDEDRHMVEAFCTGEPPEETFHDGLAVVELLMGLYRSAEIGELVRFPAPELEAYVPPTARAAE